MVVVVVIVVVILVAYKPPTIVMRSSEHGNAPYRGVRTQGAAEARRVGGNRHIHLVHVGIGRNRMGAPRGCARVIRDWYSLIGALACEVHNPQEFGGQELTFGEEVVAISGVEQTSSLPPRSLSLFRAWPLCSLMMTVFE